MIEKQFSMSASLSHNKPTVLSTPIKQLLSRLVVQRAIKHKVRLILNTDVAEVPESFSFWNSNHQLKKRVHSAHNLGGGRKNICASHTEPS